MPKFSVTYRETCDYEFIVEAADKDEANDKVSAIINAQGGTLCGSKPDNTENDVVPDLTEPAPDDAIPYELPEGFQEAFAESKETAGVE